MNDNHFSRLIGRRTPNRVLATFPLIGIAELQANEVEAARKNKIFVIGYRPRDVNHVATYGNNIIYVALANNVIYKWVRR